jgi:exopolysaccharide production protein ExoZ
MQGNPPNKLTGIEASRGIAAILVLLYHTARYLDNAAGAPLLKATFQFGHAGVDFFFVISGFIILFVHYNDIGDPARLGRYVGRRFTRLMPTYWVALALTVVMHAAGHQGAPSLANLALSASLLPWNQPMVLDIAWTLRFEVLFYALFCVLIVSRTAGLAVMAIWLSATVLAAVTEVDASWVPGTFYGAYNLEFFLGMTAAYVLRNRTVPHPRLVLATGLALFIAAAVLEDFHLLDGYGDAARLAYGIPAAIVVLGIAEADRQSLLRVPAILRTIGAASYSIYLFQFIFIATTWQVLLATGLGHRIPVAGAYVTLALAVLVGGVVTSRCVEYPLMRLVRGRRGTVQLRPAAE